MKKKQFKDKERIGEIKQMNCGDFAKIIAYKDSKNITVEFQDEYHYVCNVEYGNFVKGTIKNPYHKNRYGGYVGVGNYPATINRKGTYIYDAWIRMLERSKSESFKNKYPAYQDVDCCDEWLCFQNFAEWYDNHYYKIDGQTMEVDKDWIKFGNKIYCPEFCEIVPSIINSCLLNHKKMKNYELPTGIAYNSNKFKVRLSIEGKRQTLGNYSELKDAMSIYKKSKINYIKYLAEKYKNYIPKIIYDNMMDIENRFDKEFPEYATI